MIAAETGRLFRVSGATVSRILAEAGHSETTEDRRRADFAKVVVSGGCFLDTPRFWADVVKEALAVV
jgi:hypothetical protein